MLKVEFNIKKTLTMLTKLLFVFSGCHGIIRGCH